ncbi:MAG TPA: nucleotidyl transferase AbiEii/AbiGii toxin family protein [Kofleriaceae bacterium]|nr:nucleotidyl transferase AbiEii/AbiGii toxin family protein [Kofleriaceae bacterium]
MGSSPTKLTPLQLDVLRAFFQRESGFFLTGGAALAGYHLHHRETGDLDLFTLDAKAFERGSHVLADVAESLGASLQVVQQAPGFLRAVISKGDGALVIDLVRDRSYQVAAAKPVIDGVAVDPIEEILANKLTAVVGRAEERDLVDLFLLERSGLKIEEALPAALQKDGACTPATLAWLLSEIAVPDVLRVEAGVTAAELREWLAGLITRLRRAALPSA